MNTFSSGTPLDMLVSYRTRREIGVRQARRHGDGAHSYLAVATYFVDFLSHYKVLVRQLNRPELLPPPVNSGEHFHLSINPAEEFRAARGRTNISYIFWEYDKLLTPATAAFDRRTPLDNMADMHFALSIPDRVWVACNYAQKTLAAAGIDANVVPTPIEIPNQRSYSNRVAEKSAAATFLRTVLCFPWQFMTSVSFSDADSILSVRSSVGAIVDQESSRNAKIFFTLFNPLDPRKNLPLLIAGWREFRETSRVPCSLIIKLSTPNGHMDSWEIFHRHIGGMMIDYGELTNLEAPDVFVIFDPVSEKEMGYLRRAIDFYVAVSFCEGQNLPLAEFTLAGALPIAPLNTSLLDFIKSDGALVVKCEQMAVPPGISGRYGFRDMHWFPCDLKSYVSCLEQASLLTAAEYEARSRRAIETMRAYCGYPAVWDKFRRAISS